MSSKKTSSSASSVSVLGDTYTLTEVISVAECILNRDTPPTETRLRLLYDNLESYVYKRADKGIQSARILVCKYYDSKGEVLRISQSPSNMDGEEAYWMFKQESQDYPPEEAVYVRLFASYDGRTLDPVPVSEFPVQRLDLTTPDFPVEEED